MVQRFSVIFFIARFVLLPIDTTAGTPLGSSVLSLSQSSYSGHNDGQKDAILYQPDHGTHSKSSPLVPPHAAAVELPRGSSVFRATHNSYSGNIEGQKGTIVFQLDHGIRSLEIDIHDNHYASVGDYQVGHQHPGDAVDHTAPNPSSNNLCDWLSVIREWSDANPSHAPIQLVLDIKRDFTRNPSYAAGNLAALNQKLVDAFGQRLLWARDAPDDLVSALQTGSAALMGKIMVVLTGDERTRTLYKSDIGRNPAVARNNNGLIVEVHDDGKHLWYWSGRVNPDGSVAWLRHGRYNTGIRPSVAVSDDNVIVEVHQSHRHDTLWYHIGKIDPASCEITWSPSHKYSDGVFPFVAFTGANTLRAIQQPRNPRQSIPQFWEINGLLDLENMSIGWTDGGKTSASVHNTTESESVQVFFEYSHGNGLLHYSSGLYVGQRIAYEQVCFVEHGPENNVVTEAGAIFYAAKANTFKTWIANARNTGKLVRGYDFDNSKHASNPIANYPATNWPYAEWYEELVKTNGVAV